MPRSKDNMEHVFDGDDFSSFGPSADSDDDTPYEAFSKATAPDPFGDTDDTADFSGGLEVDLTPKGKKAPVTDDADDLEIEVVKEVPGSAKKDAAVEEEADEDDEISAEEMANYSESVKRRIGKTTRLRRTAERQRDRARAESDEAARIIAVQAQQLERMRQLIANGETQYVAAAKVANESAVAAAQDKLRKALSDGDADSIVAAQTALAQASTAMAQAVNYRAVAPEIEASTQALNAKAQQFVNQRQAQVNEPDPAAKRWMSRNDWFDKDPVMRSHAIMFAKGLEADGYDPLADAKDYYKEIDSEMRKRFPEKFSSDEADAPPMRRQPTRQQQQPNSRPVAAARSAGPVVAKNKITLTESQVRLANKLGISPADYAREYAKTYPKG